MLAHQTPTPRRMFADMLVHAALLPLCPHCLQLPRWKTYLKSGEVREEEKSVKPICRVLRGPGAEGGCGRQKGKEGRSANRPLCVCSGQGPRGKEGGRNGGKRSRIRTNWGQSHHILARNSAELSLWPPLNAVGVTAPGYPDWHGGQPSLAGIGGHRACLELVARSCWLCGMRRYACESIRCGVVS